MSTIDPKNSPHYEGLSYETNLKAFGVTALIAALAFLILGLTALVLQGGIHVHEVFTGLDVCVCVSPLVIFSGGLYLIVYANHVVKNRQREAAELEKSLEKDGSPKNTITAQTIKACNKKTHEHLEEL